MRAEIILQAEVVTVIRILHPCPTNDQVITLVVDVVIKKATYNHMIMMGGSESRSVLRKITWWSANGLLVVPY